MREPTFQDFRRLDVDGVPTFWFDQPGPTMAGLVFRVGWADETPRILGVTHLVEHLAMAPVGRTPYPSNASVDSTTTTFVARGTGEEIVRFVRAISSALTSLPLDRLAMEARVLRTEASNRANGAASHLMWLRYGSDAEGLDWLPELGLNNPQPDAVQAWAHERFNRSNCGLWIAGALPEGLAVDLPPGRRFDPPAPVTITDLALPAFATGGGGGVAIAFETSRTAAATAVLRVALHRMHERIRVAEGLAYEASGRREPLTRDRAHDTIWVSCLADGATQVRAEMLQTLFELADSGPSELEMQEDLDAFVRMSSDPAMALQHVSEAVRYELFGMPTPNVSDFVADRKTLTAADCAAELRAALRTAIVLSPPASRTSGLPPEFHAYPHFSSRVVSGRSFAPAPKGRWAAASWANWRREKRPRLIVGSEGISIVDPEGNAMTVLWQDCVALVTEKERARQVLGRDGFAISLHAEAWHGGDDALRMVDSAVPPQLRVLPPI